MDCSGKAWFDLIVAAEFTLRIVEQARPLQIRMTNRATRWTARFHLVDNIIQSTTVKVVVYRGIWGVGGRAGLPRPYKNIV